MVYRSFVKWDFRYFGHEDDALGRTSMSDHPFVVT
jgi:hypothetical protein